MRSIASPRSGSAQARSARVALRVISLVEQSRGKGAVVGRRRRGVGVARRTHCGSTRGRERARARSRRVASVRYNYTQFDRCFRSVFSLSRLIARRSLSLAPHLQWTAAGFASDATASTIVATSEAAPNGTARASTAIDMYRLKSKRRREPGGIIII